jgi:murein DD-endopeptidase MepM/ murein hydrolase activator NlpD
VKLVAALAATAVSGLLALPLLAGGTTSRAVGGCGDVPRVLDTIRTLESGSNYTITAAHASASGAYQIIDSTWAAWSAAAGVGSEYQHAFQAPPAVQDAVAGHHVQQLLDQYHDVTYVPLAWYYPAAIGNPALMDVVPAPGAGNTLTPRQYQTRWMDVYNAETTTGTAVCGPVVAGGEWSLPVDRTLIDANPAALSAPHHDYPAWDFGVPVGTIIYAIHAGTVDHVSTWSGNCANDPSACVDTCGTGLTIRDTAGVHWTYCHGSRLTVSVGDQIVAGQTIMLSGDTGHSSGPHLHVEIRINGIQHCPQPLLIELYNGTAPSTAQSLPTTGCST